MASGNFEQSLARLEEVAQHLERGDLPLEEGLALFEEGMQLARHCQDRLDAAETRIANLSAADDPTGRLPTNRDG
ncbi:MAG: exodeoxyribonuclease VII small subunit [Magnetococcales bacterium]|nr:exodeoxyribonuclease VII small subunit [Magnetococcales bacterium]